MRRTVAGMVIGGALVPVLLVGCSSGKSARPSATSGTPQSSVLIGDPSSAVEAAPAPPTTTSSPAPLTTTEADGSVSVTIDGKQRDLSGRVICSHTGDGNFNIVLSNPTVTYSVAVSVSDDFTKVRSVGLGNVDGVSLSFQEYESGVNATVNKDGNTYTVSGKAKGFDKSDLNTQITKEFEVSATCPNG